MGWVCAPVLWLGQKQVAAAVAVAEVAAEAPAAFLAAEAAIVAASVEAEVWHMTVLAAGSREQVAGIANRNLVCLHSFGDYIRAAGAIVAVVGECVVLLRGPQEGGNQSMFVWSEGDNPMMISDTVQALQFYQSLLQSLPCSLLAVLEKMIEFVRRAVFAGLGMSELDWDLL